MPELDYMVVADYVRADNGILHIMGAGIDTITAQTVPAARSIGIAIRLTFDRTDDPEAQHLVSLIFQGADKVLATITGNFAAPRVPEGVPVHWRNGAVLAMPIHLLFPEYGDYSLDLTLDDKPVKHIDLRCVPPAASR